MFSVRRTIYTLLCTCFKTISFVHLIFKASCGLLSSLISPTTTLCLSRSYAPVYTLFTTTCCFSLCSPNMLLSYTALFSTNAVQSFNSPTCCSFVSFQRLAKATPHHHISSPCLAWKGHTLCLFLARVTFICFDFVWRAKVECSRSLSGRVARSTNE